jgi:hypothetical protein
MAIFRSGPLVEAISGTIGGVTFVNSPRNTVVRKSATKVNRQTQNQLEARHFFTFYQRGWQDLSDAIRTGFNQLANNYTYTDRLGTQRHYTGFQLYMKQSTIRRTNFVLPNLVPDMDSAPGPINPTWSANEGGPFTFDADNWHRTATAVAVLYFARPFTSKALVHMPAWTRYPIEVQPAVFPGAPTDMYAHFNALLGSPAETETIGMRIAYWNVTGLLSNLVDFIVTVGPAIP